MDDGTKKNGIGKDEFRSALSRFASGVTVVTSRSADGRLHGITVSSFASVSLEPPLVLVCIEKTTGSHEALLESDHFAINVLAEGQENISNRFASTTDDKFEGVEYQTGRGDVPVLTNALVSLECRRAYAHEGGDHTIFVGLVEKSTITNENPLVYWHGSYQKLEID